MIAITPLRRPALSNDPLARGLLVGAERHRWAKP
jgi:hypothetical protein